MDNNNSIHDFDFSLICNYFSSLERQGPGSDDATLRALQFADSITPRATVADLGCGTGSSALLIARQTGAHVIAVDAFADFLTKLERNADRLGVSDLVEPIVGDMAELPFEPQSLDAIWSEGAIYNIGYERGLRYWHQYLRPGGYVAVTDAVWFRENPPEEVRRFWNDAYDQIDTVPHKIEQMQAAGYEPVATFRLSNECWTDNFYQPQHAVRQKFAQEHADNPFALDFLKNQEHEESVYAKYGDYYGYAFFIDRKPASLAKNDV